MDIVHKVEEPQAKWNLVTQETRDKDTAAAVKRLIISDSLTIEWYS